MNTILLVDDNQQNLHLLSTLLKGYGYFVATARNGIEALELARRDPPNLAITDVLMPTMDGFAFCREWMKDKALRAVPLVFYTATYTDPKDEALAMSLGAARFIVKPLETDAFLDVVRRVLEEVGSGRGNCPAEQTEEETGYYRLYNEVLIHKLEKKMLDLEATRRLLEWEIVERKAAEEGLRRAKVELEARYEELRKLDVIKDGLVRGVTHELKTPVAKQAMQLELLKQTLGGEALGEVEDIIGVMEGSVRRQEHIIGTLLDLSLLEEGGRKIALGPVDLAGVLGSAIGEHRIFLSNGTANLATNFAPLTVTADAEMLQHVLCHLLGNAIKFRKSEGSCTIDVAAFREGNEAVVTVRDNGIGLSPDDRSRIFDRFFQVTAASEGSGVGLNICRAILGQMGGTITMDSEGPGKGCTAEVRLRIAG